MHISVKRIISRILADAIEYRKKDFKSCGNRVIIHPRCHFSAPELIELGDEIFINSDCTFYGGGSIVIERGVVFSPNVTVYSCIHNYDSDDLRAFPFDDRFLFKKVTIGECSWISTNSVILPGVKIGRYCVVGANSVVTKDVDDYSIVAGAPAKEIRKRSNKKNGETWVGRYCQSDENELK